jgi:hypothetical protein
MGIIVMMPQQKTKHSQILSYEAKKNRLLFWQGYLFSIGVGGLVICTANYFKEFIYDKCHIAFIVATIMTIATGIYGVLVGYFSGSIWGCRDRLLKHIEAKPFWCSASISTPLVAYVFALIAARLRMDFIISFIPMLICAFVHWLCLTFFIMLGMRMGVRRAKQAVE